MTPMLSLAKTPMQAIYETTCLELVRELSKDLVEDRPIDETFTSMNGVDKCVQEINFSNTIKDMMNKYHTPSMHRDQDGKMRAYDHFKKKIEIMKIGDNNMSINDALTIAANLKTEAGENFYGMLLMDSGLAVKGRKKKNKKRTFNPLHPLITAELLAENSHMDKEEKIWTIAIYMFADGTIDYLKRHYKHLWNQESYALDIATLVASIDTPSAYIVENKDFEVDIQEDEFILNYKEVKRLKDSGEIIAEAKSDGRSYIIPGQIINVGGVAFPYYSTAYSTKGLAWNMSPMMAANISHPGGQSRKDGMAGGSRICTHSGNSKTQMGLSALNHCNTTSPLNSDCFEQGSLTYAEQCVSASLELLLGADFGATAAIPEKVLTFQEFVTENDGATKKQYLQYIKNRMKDKMIPDEADIAEAELAKKDLDAEQKYPNHEGGKQYNNGDIVFDPQYEGTDHKLRIYDAARGYWNDYEEPTPTQIDIPAAVTHPIFDANIEDQYNPGDITVDEDENHPMILDENRHWVAYNPENELGEAV